MAKKVPPKQKPSSDPLLVLDDDYFPVLMELLDHAQTSIEIIAFSFAIGSAGGKLNTSASPYQIAKKLVDLKKKLKSKIKIRLYIEGHRETADRNLVTAQFLENAGIEVRLGSTHAKGFCIDKKYVLFGSTNLTEQSILKNSESNLLTDDPAVSEGFENYFEHLWNGGSHGEIQLQPPLIADGGFKKSLLELIHSAKKRLEFSIYFFHHTEIEKAFIAAAERGVRVTGYFHNHSAFAMSYVRRTHGTAERLREGGVKEIFYAPTTLFTHSKYLIKDRQTLLLGTGNWLHEDIKVHPQLYILLNNKRVCQDLASHLKSLIKAGPHTY